MLQSCRCHTKAGKLLQEQKKEKKREIKKERKKRKKKCEPLILPSMHLGLYVRVCIYIYIYIYIHIYIMRVLVVTHSPQLAVMIISPHCQQMNIPKHYPFPL